MNNYYIKFFLCVLILVLIACGGSVKDVPDKVVEVSLVRLLASPNEYNGKIVEVIGFYSERGAGNTSIYLNRDDARIGNISSSVLVAGYDDGRVETSWQHDMQQERYISVRGRFNSGPNGYLGIWPGMIYPVQNISVFDEQANKWISLWER